MLTPDDGTPLSWRRLLFFLNDFIQDDKGVASSANINGEKAIRSPNEVSEGLVPKEREESPHDHQRVIKDI